MTLTKADPSYRALHRLADKLEPALKARFLKAMREARGAIDVRRLAELLEAHDPGVLERVGFWRVVREDLQAAIHPTIRETVTLMGQQAARPLGIRFDLTNPLAVRVIEERGAALVTEITDQSRRAIQRLVTQSFQQGIEPQELARRIVQHIGLTPQYSQAVENFRLRQLETVAEGLANQRADAYADRLLRHRATVIARTEVIGAANASQQALWQQSAQEGLIRPDAKRVWIVTPDDRLCPICAPMEGQEVGLSEPFQSADVGSVMNPPAHPQCRCAEGLTFPEGAVP